MKVSEHHFLLFLSSAVFIFLAVIFIGFAQFSPRQGNPLSSIIPLSPTPTPSPWLNYANSHEGYSVNYPRGWEKTEWEFHEATQLNQNRGPQNGMIWQQVKFEGKERSFQIVLWANRQKTPIPQYLRWYRHEDLDLKKIPSKSNYQVAGTEAFMFLQEKNSWGFPAVRIFFQNRDKVFELIAQSPSESLGKIYLEMLDSFKFLNFSCPAEKTVDCMPIIDGKLSDYCQKDYRAWILDNCSGAKFTD